MYHLVCAAKYRRVVMSERVNEVLKGRALRSRSGGRSFFWKWGWSGTVRTF
jgi:hypothetical protein